MALGGGKYENETMMIIQEYKADAAVLLILGGKKGSGFSVACLNKETATQLPEIFREIADKIEKDLNKSH